MTGNKEEKINKLSQTVIESIEQTNSTMNSKRILKKKEIQLVIVSLNMLA